MVLYIYDINIHTGDKGKKRVCLRTDMSRVSRSNTSCPFNLFQLSFLVSSL